MTISTAIMFCDTPNSSTFFLSSIFLLGSELSSVTFHSVWRSYIIKGGRFAMNSPKALDYPQSSRISMNKSWREFFQLSYDAHEGLSSTLMNSIKERDFSALLLLLLLDDITMGAVYTPCPLLELITQVRYDKIRSAFYML